MLPVQKPTQRLLLTIKYNDTFQKMEANVLFMQFKCITFSIIF